MNPRIAFAGGVVTGIAIASVVGFRMGQLAKPMPCHEDQAMIWVNAPNTVTCVNLDDLVVSFSPEEGPEDDEEPGLSR